MEKLNPAFVAAYNQLLEVRNSIAAYSAIQQTAYNSHTTDAATHVVNYEMDKLDRLSAIFFDGAEIVATFELIGYKRRCEVATFVDGYHIEIWDENGDFVFAQGFDNNILSNYMSPEAECKALPVSHPLALPYEMLRNRALTHARDLMAIF